MSKKSRVRELEIDFFKNQNSKSKFWSTGFVYLINKHIPTYTECDLDLFWLLKKCLKLFFLTKMANFGFLCKSLEKWVKSLEICGLENQNFFLSSLRVIIWFWIWGKLKNIMFSNSCWPLFVKNSPKSKFLIFDDGV